MRRNYPIVVLLFFKISRKRITSTASNRETSNLLAQFDDVLTSKLMILRRARLSLKNPRE